MADGRGKGWRFWVVSAFFSILLAEERDHLSCCGTSAWIESRGPLRPVTYREDNDLVPTRGSAGAGW